MKIMKHVTMCLIIKPFYSEIKKEEIHFIVYSIISETLYECFENEYRHKIINRQ